MSLRLHNYTALTGFQTFTNGSGRPLRDFLIASRIVFSKKKNQNFHRTLHCPVEIALEGTEQIYSKFVYLRAVHLYDRAFGLVPILRRLPLTIRGKSSDSSIFSFGLAVLTII